MSRVPPDVLLSECQFRLRVVEPGFTAREVIGPGTVLYDPILGWVEDDGTLYFSDHGPQADPTTWVPYAGHGTI